MSFLEAKIKDINACLAALELLVTEPPPVHYTNLCKFVLTFFLTTLPLGVKTKLGVWANIMSPFLIAVVLLCLNRTSEELENPLGDDSEDICLLEMVHKLENQLEQLVDASDEELRLVRRDRDALERETRASQGATRSPGRSSSS